MFGLIDRFRKASGPAVPDGVRVYAIGDVHGCLQELERLLGNIAADSRSGPAESHLVFVGDLVDRGPDSAGVIDRLLHRPLPGFHQAFLLGNHEEAMLDAWNGDLETLQGWLSYGGRETLESYGIDRSETYRPGSEIVRRMHDAVPAEHIAFLKSFRDRVRIGDYLFVHAGVRPGVPLDQQDSYDLRWIRGEFLDDGETDHGAMIVHGHTISEEPDVRPNRIGIDTGCFSSGRLTALVLQGAERRFLAT